MEYEKITHIDLFSGIGGFSLATDRVFGNVKHVFVEWDDFCQEVLKKHWPKAEIHGDIDKFIADASNARIEEMRGQEDGVFLLTGGFPCQPFSQAGRRQGTADDRYKWPSMLAAIALFKPRWVIAENVAGLASWNDGLVLETVCADLEREGYEVQSFIIPACAVGAPHRRDRIWIVAYCESGRKRISKRKRGVGRKSETETGNGDRNAANTRCEYGEQGNFKGYEQDSSVGTSQTNETERRDTAHAPNAKCPRHAGQEYQARPCTRHHRGTQSPDWAANWLEVAARLCRVDDGVPRRLDRNSRLKSLGNAIVPQIVEEIIKRIKEVDL